MRKLIRSTTALLTLLSPLTLWAGPDAMTHDEARHLIARTGFGAAPDEVAALIGLSYAEGVDQILAGVQTQPSTPMPAWADAWFYPHDQIWALGDNATDLFFANRYLDLGQLQNWWLGEMIQTPSPLTEKLTLFWHDHFATSADAHESPQWAAQQNQLFRTHAAGNFADLATAILQDPAMLVFLTNTENHRAAPNENFAREFMELFTLGEGRGYTEADVVEAARALTGHTVNDFGAGEYVFDPDSHDAGTKTILGQTGQHNADDLARITLNDPNFGPFVVERLWRAFVSHQPDPDEVARLTALWRAADWELQPLLRAMFLSDAFWDHNNRGTLVKSPVDLLVGSLRTFGVTMPYLNDLNWAVGELGQELFLPPNVGGWPEGTDWINDATASGRATMLTYFLGYDPDVAADDPAMMMQQTPPVAMPATDAGDLSIGQVFLLQADKGNGGGKLTLTLFDVGFRGHHWRSVSFVAEVRDAADFEIALHVSDCAPTCFADWPYPQEDVFGWIWFDSDSIANDDIDWMSSADKALVASMMGHLPKIVQATEGQRLWTQRRGGTLTQEEAYTGATWLAAFADRTLGAPDGGLHIAPYPPASVGLGGINTAGMTEDDAERYIEEREEAQNTGATPPVQYADADAWLRAIPEGGFDSLRAEAALLALPLPAEGNRMERDASDPEALIRHIVLSPFYQLN